MSEQLQLRRGTAAQVASFTGAQGEVVVDTTNNRLVVQDGSTAGGYAVATAQRKALASASYTALGTDRIIAYAALSSSQTITLPAASAFPPGERLLVIDEAGAASPTSTITVSRAGSDTINGQSAFVINCPYGFVALESNGSNAWTVTDSLNTVAQTPYGANIQFGVLEFLQSGLSGSSVTCSQQIPANCVLFSVGCRVVTTISGPTSFAVGDSGSGDGGASATRFGSGLGLSAGSSNYGLIGPTAIYSAVNLVLTPTGGAFTAGAVRLSVHFATMGPSTS